MNKLCILVALFLAIFSTAPLSAHEGKEELENAPTAYWHINLDAQGNAVSNVSLYANELKINPADAKAGLTAGLRSALQCDPRKVDFHAWENGINFRASCRLPVTKQNFDMRALIKPGEMLQQVRKTGAKEVILSLSVPRLGYNRVSPKLEALDRYDAEIRYQIDVKNEQKSVDDIAVQFGYKPSVLLGELALMGFILITPVLLILRLSKKVLLHSGHDATIAWFGYWRSHRWIVAGAWLVWISAVISLRIDTLLDFYCGADNLVIFTLIVMIPPATVSLLCQYLARPVWRRVRGIDLDRKHMLAKGFWEHAAVVAPLVCVTIGVISVFRDSGNPMLWFAIALVSRIAGAWMYGKVSRSMPRPLHGGDLHEKVLSLARQAGVRINEVSIMPAQIYQMGNAFAMRGGKVIITDYLLERLTKSETDCVIAHEIGHVKRHHTLIFSWFGFFGIYILLNLLLHLALGILPTMLAVATESDMNRILQVNGWIECYLLYPLTLLLTLLILNFISRRFERTADEFATLLTGNPESMITMLTKLSKMNLLPLQWGFWDESLGTHPAVARRCKTIAHSHRIAADRLRELLEAQPVREHDNGYAVPDEAVNPSLVFSTEYKTQKSIIIWLIIMISLTVPPLLAGHFIHSAGFPPFSYLAGIILTPIFYLLVANFTSLIGYKKLKRELRRKLQKAGIGLDWGHVYFVGIAPGEHPRAYENYTVWDIGFLIMGENEMRYYGDRISFKVPRENIQSIVKGPRYPGWFDVPEAYIRGAHGDKAWVFHLHSVDGRSMNAIARESQKLLRTLIDWHQGRLAGLQPVSSDRQLDLPEFPDLKGNHPRGTVTVKGFATSLTFITLLVFGLASLFRLEGFLAWYGFGISALTMIIVSMPVLKYREGLSARNTLQA